MSKGKVFVISGPSGAGKGTLVASLMDAIDNTFLSVSATTRDPRPGDVNGQSYHFMSEDEFRKLIDEEGFLEWACYSGNYYGTPAKPVEDSRNAGKHAILEIDVQGAMQVKEKLPEAHFIFIEPPSLEVLEQRLRARGTDSEEAIAKRMKAASGELSQKGEYERIITNDDLETAKAEFLDYVMGIIEETRG